MISRTAKTNRLLLFIEKIIVVILFFVFSICFLEFEVSAKETDKAYMDTSDATNKIYPNIEKFVYEIDEMITFNFVIENDIALESVDSIFEGCIETKPLINNGDSVDVTIIPLDNMNSIKYTLIATFNNKTQISSSIYGVIKEKKVYINSDSFFLATDLYWTESFKKCETSKDKERINYDYEMYIKNISSLVLNEKITMIKNDKKSVNSEEITSVTGTIRWFDDWHQPHPLQFSKIVVMDEGGGFLGWSDVKLGETYTNQGGEYSFNFSNRSGGRNIYLKIYAGGSNSTVKTATGNDYFLRTQTTYSVSSGTTIVRDQDIVNGYEITQAFQISQAINLSSHFVKEISGVDMPNVTVIYPDNDIGDDCFCENNTIHICGSNDFDSVLINNEFLHSYSSLDVIQHEYFHYVQKHFGLDDNPGGWHVINANIYDHYLSNHHDANFGNCTHNGEITCANPSVNEAKDFAIRLAYEEAWPSIMTAISQQYAMDNFGLNEYNHIETFADSTYSSYNGTLIHYDFARSGGETFEECIMGLLWDLYDSVGQGYDDISLSAQEFWNLSIDSGAKTLSDLINYFVNNYSSFYYVSRLGSILSKYQVAPTRLSVSINENSSPTIDWISNGINNNLRNDLFYVVFYDTYHNEIIKIETDSAFIVLNQEEWHTILCSYGQNFYVTILAYQTSAPTTGGYYSHFINCAKPTPEVINQNISISDTSRYYERVIELLPGQEANYRICFTSSGLRNIQTFGTKDTYLYLYSVYGELLVYNDDAGSTINALINYNFKANDEYILKVKFYSLNDFGETTLAIIPSETFYNNYESIQNIYLNYATSYVEQMVNVSPGFVYMYTLKTAVSGEYHITTNQDNNSSVQDTFLYLIDPESTNGCIWDDDSGIGLNAAIDAFLLANKRYLVIISPFNITHSSGLILLTINKI